MFITTAQTTISLSTIQIGNTTAADIYSTITAIYTEAQSKINQGLNIWQAWSDNHFGTAQEILIPALNIFFYSLGTITYGIGHTVAIAVMKIAAFFYIATAYTLASWEEDLAALLALAPDVTPSFALLRSAFTATVNRVQVVATEVWEILTDEIVMAMLYVKSL